MHRVPKTKQNLALEELNEGGCGWSCIVMEGCFHCKDSEESLKDFQQRVGVIFMRNVMEGGRP